MRLEGCAVTVDPVRGHGDTRAMKPTVVIQSHAADAPEIVRRASESVRAWAASNGFDYAFKGDELFELISAACREAAGTRMQMAADIARLAWIQALLDDGARRVVWLDADIFVFRPGALSVDVDEGYAFGREHWVQPGKDAKLRVFNNVHNAVLVFTPEGRTTLDFYRAEAARLLCAAGPDVPAQLVGPKLLTALHNVVRFPLLESVGMASPLVLEDLSKGGGPTWKMLDAAHGGELAALNLSTSLIGGTTDGVAVTETLLHAAVDNLPR